MIGAFTPLSEWLRPQSGSIATTRISDWKRANSWRKPKFSCGSPVRETSKASGKSNCKSSVVHYTASGSELSVVGSWRLELLVRRPAEPDWRTTMPIEIGKTAPEARVPGPPPRFSGLIAALGILAACGALTALVIGLRRQRSRRTLTEFGTALILICLVALGATRISQTANADVRNPIPRSQASVAAGAKTYQAHCVVYHGADARGDGPKVQTLNPPPADLTASHIDAHTDGDLAGWIKNGYPGWQCPDSRIS